MTILILGSFDTKAGEHAFLRNQILARGHRVLTLNFGVLGSTDQFPVDFEADSISIAGGLSLETLRENHDRGEAMKVMSRGAEQVVGRLFEEGRFDGVIGMGGSGGTSVITAAMRALPIGVPKVCVTTVAGADTSPYVGIKDIVLIPSIVDVAGVNRISRIIFTRAAGAICGMVEAVPEEAPTDKPVIAASMFGNTTECVGMCREQLEQAGYEVLTFHAVGTGGRMLESLVEEGFIDGVLDITTTEWADELCGGVFSAGTDRLSAPGRAGVPHLIVPGCIDMVNFGARPSVPEKYRNSDRTFYEWNPEVTLMRTTAEENRELGRIFAEKANASLRPVSFLIPTRGFSILGGDGERFCDPAADQAFTDSLKASLEDRHRVVEIETNINSPAFAEKAVEMLLEMMSSQVTS